MRRTQAERAARMRRHLLEHTYACLAETGYANCSTIEILKRAGVSRGALFHHFPNKADLVARAVWDYTKVLLAQQVNAQTQAAKADAPLAEQLRLAWTFTEKDFFVFTEFRIAARNDPELLAAYLKLMQEEPALDANTSAVAWSIAPGDPSPLLSRYVVGCFLNGLVLSSMFVEAQVLEDTFNKFVRFLKAGLADLNS